MVDKSDLSVDEILAMCRQIDGGDSAAPVADSASEPPAPESTVESTADAASSDAQPVASPSAESADPSSMSVDDILAAARGGASESETSAAAEPVPVEPATDAPAPVAAGPVDTSGMSVDDILAAARGGGGAAKPAAAKPKAAKPKPAAPVAAAKEVAEPDAPVGPRDTSSILAAARKQVQRGPSVFETADEKPIAVKPKLEVPSMPKRPVLAADSKKDSDRRGFLSILFGTPLAVGFTSLAVTHVLWLLGLARFLFPNVLTEPPTNFKVGFPGDYSPGQVEAKYKAQFGVWVVRFEYQGEPQVYALKSVCTHLGCTPNWLEGEQKFKCPCHGSGFYKDGVNFEGPAPRPLERYAIRVADDGQLEIDKSRKFNEELGQWADSNSYVPV